MKEYLLWKHISLVCFDYCIFKVFSVVNCSFLDKKINPMCSFNSSQVS